MRLAILGNSHSACLLHASRNDPAVMKGLDFTFYASIGKNMADFAVADDKLVPQTDYLRDSIATTSGGNVAFDPSRYDAILMIGLGFNVAPIDRRLSRAVQEAAVRNAAECSTSWKLTGLVRELSNIPVFVGHSPLRAGNITRRNVHIVETALPYEQVIEMSQAVWDQRKATVVRQPDHTRFEDVLTKRSYSRGSRGLRGPGLEHDDTDRSHMNDEFGADYLHHLRPMLGIS